MQETEKIFTDLIKSIERRRSELKELIRTQEKAAVSRAEEIMKKLDQEVAELKKRDTVMEEVLYTEDLVQYLQVTSWWNSAEYLDWLEVIL